MSVPLTRQTAREILRMPEYVQAMKTHGLGSPQVRAVLLSIEQKRQAIFLHNLSMKKAA